MVANNSDIDCAITLYYKLVCRHSVHCVALHTVMNFGTLYLPYSNFGDCICVWLCSGGKVIFCLVFDKYSRVFFIFLCLPIKRSNFGFL